MISEFSGDYRWLSNFWPCHVTAYGLEYGSVEEAYQAAKCDNPKERRLFQGIGAAAAKKLGRSVRMKDGFDEVKLTVMETLLRRKFQDPELRTKLLATGEQELVEGNWWGDTYWGVCRGRGQNHLGRLLMKLRKELREERKQ